MKLRLGYFRGFQGYNRVVLLCGDSAGLDHIAMRFRELENPKATPLELHSFPFAEVHRNVKLTAMPAGRELGVRAVSGELSCAAFHWHHSTEGWLEAAEKIELGERRWAGAQLLVGDQPGRCDRDGFEGRIRRCLVEDSWIAMRSPLLRAAKGVPVLSPSEFRDLVSGRQRGFRATLLRGLLRVAETPYAAAMRVRNWRYDTGRAAVRFVSVPVVSVGNLTLGGTGKTPLVEWLARWLRARGVRVALVSRGYGAEAAARNDEALELEERLPDVPHLQNPDRVAAARMAIEEFECQLHRARRRLPASPAGPRSRHRADRRPGAVWLRPRVSARHAARTARRAGRGPRRGPLAGRLARTRNSEKRSRPPSARCAPRSRLARIGARAAAAGVAGGAEQPLDALQGRRVAAFCGIGNPAGFRRTLKASARRSPISANSPTTMLTTAPMSNRWGPGRAGRDARHHGDPVHAQGSGQAGRERTGGVPLWAVAIGLEIMGGQCALEARLLPLCEGGANVLPAKEDPGKAG